MSCRTHTVGQKGGDGYTVGRMENYLHDWSLTNSESIVKVNPFQKELEMDFLDIIDELEVLAPDRFMSASEVATLLHISRKTVWAHARQGLLEYVRTGRNFRFTPLSVAAYLASDI